MKFFTLGVIIVSACTEEEGYARYELRVEVEENFLRVGGSPLLFMWVLGTELSLSALWQVL